MEIQLESNVVLSHSHTFGVSLATRQKDVALVCSDDVGQEWKQKTKE